MKRAFLLILIGLFIASLAALCAGCEVPKQQKGELVTETYSVTEADAFSVKNLAVTVSGEERGPIVEIVQDGGEPSVTVTMQKSMFDTVKLQQTGKKIMFSGQKKYRYLTDYDVTVVVKNCIFQTIDLSYATTATVANGCLGTDLFFNLSGASQLHADVVDCNAFETDASGASAVRISSLICSSASVDLSGASAFSANALSATSVHADISGASRVRLVEGSAETLLLDSSGASSFGTVDFTAHRVRLDVSGASTIAFTSDGSITGDASGASRIEYKGNATTSVDLSGSSTINKA